MIQLNPDCLIFQTAEGTQIPFPAQKAAFELMDKSAVKVEPEVLQNASAAVLHYFKNELKQNFVSVPEFAGALGKVMDSLDVALKPKNAEIKVVESSLAQLADETGGLGELMFFPRLRQEMARELEQGPQVLRFCGLRDCALKLAGVSRWNGRARAFNDQIVSYLRSCWSERVHNQSCALVIL